MSRSVHRVRSVPDHYKFKKTKHYNSDVEVCPARVSIWCDRFHSLVLVQCVAETRFCLAHADKALQSEAAPMSKGTPLENRGDKVFDVRLTMICFADQRTVT